MTQFKFEFYLFPSPSSFILSKKMLISRKNLSLKRELSSSINRVHLHWRVTLTDCSCQKAGRPSLGSWRRRARVPQQIPFLQGGHSSDKYFSLHRRLPALPPFRCCQSTWSFSLVGRVAKDLPCRRALDLLHSHKEMAVVPGGKLYLLLLPRQIDLRRSDGKMRIFGTIKKSWCLNVLIASHFLLRHRQFIQHFNNVLLF